ncbi:unnamed protein product [Cutaneotrichosporon oleaginosum]
MPSPVSHSSLTPSLPLVVSVQPSAPPPPTLLLAILPISISIHILILVLILPNPFHPIPLSLSHSLRTLRLLRPPSALRPGPVISSFPPSS